MGTQGPLYLMLTADAGRPSVGLFDGRAAIRPSPVSFTTAGLTELVDSHADRPEDLGKKLFSALPTSIRRCLRETQAHEVCLQLDPELLEVPWELALTGSGLPRRFSICRQVLSDLPRPERARVQRDPDFLKVLVLAGEHTAGDAPGYSKALRDTLRACRGIFVSRLRGIDAGKAEILAALTKHDVLHFVGRIESDSDRPLDGGLVMGRSVIGIGDLCRAAESPQLVFVEAPPLEPELGRPDSVHRLAHGFFSNGLSVIVDTTSAAQADKLDQLRRVYAALGSGRSLGHALWRSDGKADHRIGGIGTTRYALYGPPGEIVFEQAAPDRRQEGRRQLTVMFCDIVGSTELSRSLDAEEWREILERYRTACAGVVAAHHGYAAEYVGDGIVIYFGYPTAHEDGAWQAVRCGIRIIEVLRESGLRVRLGVHTGEVVMADQIAVGEVPVLASRLQSVADANTVVVSAATRRLVARKFELERLEGRNLKGFTVQQPVYRVVRERVGAGTALRGARPTLTPFVGRAEELERLRRVWNQARRGALAGVTVCGEAGIGKSRLVNRFLESLRPRSHSVIAWRCDNHRSSSAFHPVIEYLRELLEITEHYRPEIALKKIASLFRSTAPDDAVVPIASLLSIPLDGLRRRSQYPPERQREMTLDTVAQWLIDQARLQPLCLVVEDVHWIDPSTGELLDRLLLRGAGHSIFLLMTRRSENGTSWEPGPTISRINLGGLPRRAAANLIARAQGEAELTPETVQALVERTDGVPLFIEESLQMALDADERAFDGAAGSALGFAVPDTIQDLLMARLDRLPAAKEVAQVGGTIGREFSYELLQAVMSAPDSPLRVTNLDDRLGLLVESGLVRQEGAPPEARYVFKHALVRDTAYLSLLKSTRRQLHRQVAAVLVARFPRLSEAHPERLALHLTEAGIPDQAIEHWQRAGFRAMEKSALLEAIEHFSAALELIDRLPAGAERDRIELRLQVLLAGRLIATRGYGAPEVETAYRRALELCRRVEDDKQLLKVRLGLESYHFMRGDFASALDLARRSLAMVDPASQDREWLQANWALASVRFHQGKFDRALARMDECIDRFAGRMNRLGGLQSPQVMCLGYSAWMVWQLGYPDDGLGRADSAVEFAFEVRHPYSQGVALGLRAALHFFRGDHDHALRDAEQAYEICEAHHFPVWSAFARLLIGRIQVGAGQREEGIAEIRRAYDAWSSTGAILTQAFYLSMLAESLALDGRPAEGLEAVGQALEIVERHDERYYDPEIRRLHGELLLQSSSGAGDERAVEAGRWFDQALKSARRRGYRMLELRAATSLGRHWRAIGRTGDAAQLLAEVLSQFSEGAETADVKAATRLLSRLTDPA